MDQYEEKALSDIEEYGCHVLSVMEEAEYPGFTYSIGIEKKTKQPEVIITGLKQEIAHWMVNEYNNRVKAGEVFEAGKFYPDFLEGFDVTFKEVEKKHYTEYFGWGRWLYNGNDFRVLQLVYPTTAGIWPWEANASEDYKWYIPKLYAN